jgi:hypothetical protein
MTLDPVARALSLPIWSGTPKAEPLGGGITNLNVRVTDNRRSAVVRIGDDIPVHQIMPRMLQAFLRQCCTTNQVPW